MTPLPDDTAIATLLQWAKGVLLEHSDSASLDAQLLLCHVLGCDRTYLLTWPEKCLSEPQALCFQGLISERCAGQPVAYLIGEREFWSLGLEVSAATLIPRPETELLVELALGLPLPAHARVLDLGTGTGAIALALASERSYWQVTATDLQPAAVELAGRNAERLGLRNVEFCSGHWFNALQSDAPLFDLIVSNPPYIDSDDPHLREGDVRFEPRSALVAAEHGYADLFHIAEQGRSHLKPGGWLLLEHGWEQAEEVCQRLQQLGYQQVSSCKDLLGHLRCSYAQWPETAAI